MGASTTIRGRETIMKISPIMKTIICPATLPTVEKLYSHNPVNVQLFTPELTLYPWKLHPVQKHWCCLPCQCPPYPVKTKERSTFNLSPHPHDNQFDLRYYHTSHSSWNSWSLRIHMPWGTLDTLLYILITDLQSLKTTATRIGSGCLTTLVRNA